MNENCLQFEGTHSSNYQMRLIEEIMGKNGNTNIPNLHATSHNGHLHHMLAHHKKKEKGGKCRDRYIGTINQSSYLNSIALNTQKQTISKHKNQSKSHKTQQQQNQLTSNPNQINNNNNNPSFQSPINPRLLRSRLQQISITSNSNLNTGQPSSSSNLSPLLQFPAALSLTNLSFNPSQQQLNNQNDEFSQSSTNLQNPSRLSNRNFKINPISFQTTTNPYSSTAMDQEERYDQDEIIESKEIQEELQDEQTCKYIQLLKKGFDESPLSKGSPFLNGGPGMNQKRKILNFFNNNEVSDDMKNAFSLHSLNNINEKNSNIGSMNSFILSTINDASEITMHETACSANNINTKLCVSGRSNQQSSNQIYPPTIIDTIELRPNMIEEDFYQNILDWNRQKRVAAMADSTMIHLTDFKTQKNDAILSNSMLVCNIDYLPHFQQLLTQSITSNCNSIPSWSINSSTHFLSSQKKQNRQIQSGRFDIQQTFSSTSLQTAGLASHSMNFLNMNQIEDTESLEEEGENIEEFSMNEESKKSERSSKNCSEKGQVKDFIVDDEDEEENINISSFNLNTPSPNQENKQQQSNQLNYSGIFSIAPLINSPIAPQSTTYYSVLKFSPSGHILAAGRSDGILEIYDIEKKQALFTARCHSKLISALSINNSYLATASQDSKVVIFDLRDLSRITLAAYLSSRNSSSILSLEWNPLSENTLAASTESGHINLYNLLKDNKCSYKEFHLRESSIKTIAWNPFKRGILLAGSLDGFIFLIDLEKKSLLQRKKILNHIYKIIFSPNQSDRFICLTGNQPENNTQNRNNLTTSSLMQNQQSPSVPTNQEIINDDFGLQTGNMFVLSYPSINKIHQVQVGQKRVCQGILSHDGSTVYTLSKDNYLRQWKVFREPQLDNTNSSILTSAQELR